VEKKVPSIQQFLTATTPQEFQALAGGKSKKLASTKSKLPTLFRTQKTIFTALEGKASMRAINAAMDIIALLKNSEEAGCKRTATSS
jgi:hypothetical protein